MKKVKEQLEGLDQPGKQLNENLDGTKTAVEGATQAAMLFAEAQKSAADETLRMRKGRSLASRQP